MKKRRWIGTEIGPVDDIVSRLENMEDEAEYLEKMRKDYNCLFTDQSLKKRIEYGLWTPESVKKKHAKKQQQKRLFEENSAQG